MDNKRQEILDKLIDDLIDYPDLDRMLDGLKCVAKENAGDFELINLIRLIDTAHDIAKLREIEEA